MSESIPLRSTLRVHMVDIIVCKTGGKGFDLVLENFPSKSRKFGDIQWQAP